MQVWVLQLFRECCFKPRWQHGLVSAMPGRIVQVERRHPVLGRRVMLSWFRAEAADTKITPLIDAHRIDIAPDMFELWGIARADGWTDNFYPQAWRVWLSNPSPSARRPLSKGL